MLSLSRVSQHQGQNYYVKDNYYAKENSVKNSEWQGQGAESLGLAGKVNAKVFQGLLEGRSPKENVNLNCMHENSGVKRRAGLDLTFSAPKSLSIAALVGGDKRLELAHKEAVKMALGVAEERYAVTRTGAKNARVNENTCNIIAAKFHHDTSRAKDPQLHTHCVLINAVKRKDGEWRSLYNDEFFSNSKLLGLIYQNDLAARVKQLGYAIEIKSNGTFELKGYLEEQLRAFSKRREQIEELGCKNQKEARSLVKIDRPTKGKNIDRLDMQDRWESEAENLQIVHPVSNSIAQLDSKKMLEVKPEKEFLNSSSILMSASSHATEKDVSFKREKLESYALENNLGALDWRALQREIFKQECSRKLIQHDSGRYTTTEALQTEQNILAIAREGMKNLASIVENPQATLAENRWGLNKGQLSAVQLAFETRDQFIIWHGVAGAGKTYAMNVVREIGTEQKISLRGFAPSAEAAKVLETEAKIPAQTVASLLANPGKTPTNNRNELWIVDEAGLLSARDSEKLMQRAKEQNARVILVGDTRQLSAVEAGNPFRLLRMNGVATAELSENRRQKNTVLKTSVDYLANGQQAEAIEAISAQIIERKRESNRLQYITNEFIKLTPTDRKETLILAGTNRERELLTTEIRTALKTEKSIGESAAIKTLHARSLSHEELGVAAKMEVGDILFFHKQAKENSIQKGDKYQVVAVDLKRNILTISNINADLNNQNNTVSFNPNRHKNSFLVYERKELEVCKGEKLRWTKNDKSLGIRNGEECILDTFSNDKLNLKSKSGKEITIPRNGTLHLDHNYVNTVFSSQGKTCDRVIISVDKTFGCEAMYVALSRAKHEAKIITPDKEEMLKTISQSRAKLSALDLIPEEKLMQDIDLSKHNISNQNNTKINQGNKTRQKL